MAELGLDTTLTLSEIIRRENPDGTLADLVDVLNKQSAVLKYGTWIECNNGTYHEDTRTAFEPSGSERGYDMGVDKEAGGTEKATEPTCMLDGLSEIDAAKLKHTPDQLAARMQEDDFFLRGMSKTAVSRFFDGDRSSNPLRINGLNVRAFYNSLTSPDTNRYVYDNAGGNASVTANKTSIYIIQFGPKKVNWTYPRNDPQGGTEYGIHMEDFGRNLITDGAGKKYPAWQTWFEFHFGLFIHDPRCIKRICNISTTNIDGVDDFSFNEDSLIDAASELEYNGEGAIIVCNRTVSAQMWKRLKDKANVNFSVEQAFGKPVLAFNLIPIFREDQITNTQATVTA